MPTLVLFYQENGLSMKEVLLVQSFFSIGLILFEIPSGYFSDVVGRKTTIILGSILGFLGLLSYSFSYGFTGFLISELTLGFGASLISGTDSALIYDSLAQLKKENDYKKVEGKVGAIQNCSEAIASFLAGFLAIISLRTPFYVETIFMFLTIPLAMTLVEPLRHKYENKEGTLKEIYKITKYALHDNAQIKWLVLYAGFVSASTLTMVWFIQPYFQMVNLPLAYFGIVWGILNGLVAVFSYYAYRIEAFFGRKTTLISLILISFLAYMLLVISNSLIGILFIVLFYFVRGVSNPVIKDYVNVLIKSEVRATILSIKGFVARLIFAITGPLIGWVNDLYSLQAALLASGTIFLIFGLVSLGFLHKNRAL